MVRRALTKTLSIERDPKTVFWFLADGENWPRWAVVNVMSAKYGPNDWWQIETPHGPGRLRIRHDEAFGILDHEVLTSDAQWTVPMRIVPNGDGTELVITCFQGANVPDSAFDQQMADVDRELATLKKILEER